MTASIGKLLQSTTVERTSSTRPEKDSSKTGKTWVEGGSKKTFRLNLTRTKCDKLTGKINFQHLNQLKNGTAKNVILMMGDGLGVSTLAAARIYMAQQRGIVGEDAVLSWERMPHTAFSKARQSKLLV